MTTGFMRVTTDTCEISVQPTGSGLPLIIIAGGPGLSSRYLVDPLRELSDTYRVVFFDQPGCGLSTCRGVPTVAQAVQATVAVIREAAEDGRYALLAHSWGAYLAARACLECPVTPVATVLLNPVPLDRAGFDSVGGRLIARVRPETLERIDALSAVGTREAGEELMRLAMPAYCGRDANIPAADIDFDIQTSNAVTTDLGQYELWHAIERMGDVTAIFGRTDYILPSDYVDHVPLHNVTVLDSGHFTMLDARHDLIAAIRGAVVP